MSLAEHPSDLPRRRARTATGAYRHRHQNTSRRPLTSAPPKRLGMRDAKGSESPEELGRQPPTGAPADDHRQGHDATSPPCRDAPSGEQEGNGYAKRTSRPPAKNADASSRPERQAGLGDCAQFPRSSSRAPPRARLVRQRQQPTKKGDQLQERCQPPYGFGSMRKY